MLLAGVLLKMGTYGLIRFNLPLFPHVSHLFAPLISMLAIVGIIYGALVAMVQPDMKKLVAYSSVSHLGFIVLGIFSFTPQGMEGAIYQMLNHGVSTGALFLLVGVIYDRRHTGSSKVRRPRIGCPYAAFSDRDALAIGLPGPNGFVGEFPILLGISAITRAPPWRPSVIFSAVYMLWMYQRVIWGEIDNERGKPPGSGWPRASHAYPAIDSDRLDGRLLELLPAADGCVRDEVTKPVADAANRIRQDEMNFASLNIYAILPAIVLSVFGIAVMVAEPFVSEPKKSGLGWLALTGAVAAMFALIPMAANRGQWYSNLWIVDDYDIFLSFVFLLIAAITILTSIDYLRREHMNHPEFYALLLFATAGMLMMAGSNELMMVFLGLEILSIATYVMAGFRRTDLRSNESALKYFLLGSFSSAFFLYGVALIFGATGSTNLIGIAESLRSSEVQVSLVELSAALMLIALCFKVAVAPFHIWTPDVYEGAPTPVTGFMSVGPKAAGFAVLFRVFLTAFPSIQDRWGSAIWLIAALTMVLGNVIAVVQPNIKRMLAYSSIALGYVAVAFAATSGRGVSAALFYLLATAMNLGAFAIVTILAAARTSW